MVKTQKLCQRCKEVSCSGAAMTCPQRMKERAADKIHFAEQRRRRDILRQRKARYEAGKQRRADLREIRQQKAREEWEGAKLDWDQMMVRHHKAIQAVKDIQELYTDILVAFFPPSLPVRRQPGVTVLVDEKPMLLETFIKLCNTIIAAEGSHASFNFGQPYVFYTYVFKQYPDDTNILRVCRVARHMGLLPYSAAEAKKRSPAFAEWWNRLNIDDYVMLHGDLLNVKENWADEGVNLSNYELQKAAHTFENTALNAGWRSHSEFADAPALAKSGIPARTKRPVA